VSNDSNDSGPGAKMPVPQWGTQLRKRSIKIMIIFDTGLYFNAKNAHLRGIHLVGQGGFYSESP